MASFGFVALPVSESSTESMSWSLCTRKSNSYLQWIEVRTMRFSEHSTRNKCEIVSRTFDYEMGACCVLLGFALEILMRACSLQFFKALSRKYNGFIFDRSQDTAKAIVMRQCAAETLSDD